MELPQICIPQENSSPHLNGLPAIPSSTTQARRLRTRTSIILGIRLVTRLTAGRGRREIKLVAAGVIVVIQRQRVMRMRFDSPRCWRALPLVWLHGITWHFRLIWEYDFN